jgi:hypothetical protein
METAGSSETYFLSNRLHGVTSQKTVIFFIQLHETVIYHIYEVNLFLVFLSFSPAFVPFFFPTVLSCNSEV